MVIDEFYLCSFPLLCNAVLHQFRQQALLRAIEINDVIRKGTLPVKLESKKLFSSDAGPQQTLRVSHVLSQGPRCKFQFLVVVYQSESSCPPLKKEGMLKR